MTARSRAKHLSVIALFITAALLTMFYKVERHGRAGTINLTAIPAEIGDWRMLDQDTSSGSKESRFLNDIMYRTYRRTDGKTIMLAVAYGADQRKKYSIHSPEVCYRASGFDVTSRGQLFMQSPDLKLKQLLVKDGATCTEPVQYWIILDGRQVTSELEKRIKHFYYSILGAEADGVLVRVSSISTDREFHNDYQVQQDFVSALYRSVDPQLRKLLFGKGV